MKKKIFVICLALISGFQAHAQENISKDSLVSDFSYLIKELEATHPDPYSGFGGKVYFHKQAYDFTNDLKENNYTLQEFTDKVSAFLSNLQDGHTILSQTGKKERNKAGIFILSARVIPGGLIVGEVPVESKEYLGSRILGINGMTLDSLLKVVSMTEGCENQYGQYAWLSHYMIHSDFILKLFPETKDCMTVNVETPEGIKKELVIPLIDKTKRNEYPVAKLPEWKEIPTDTYMSYRFMDPKKDVMLFKLSSVMARENFETTISENWPNAYEQMKDFYKWTLKNEMPADTTKALQGIPSYSETFLQLLTDMKKNKSRTLIIDLRGNGGGWTPITLPTLYQLFGDKYLQTDMNIHYYSLISPLFLQKRNTTLESFNQQYNMNYRMGEYIFGDAGLDTSDITVQRANFIKNCMSDTKPKLEKQQGKPVYTPDNIYVITDEWTFSAAFHYAFYLWKMGATVVGVPSMQAPNTFMEQTFFQLPNTKLNGSISNAVQIYLSAKNPRAKVFWPDLMPSYDDYKRYQFDKHSEILYLLDKMK